MSDLWTAYLNADPPLAPFFAHRPGDWASAVEARRRLPSRPLDPSAVEEIVRANASWGVAPRVVDRAAALASPETLVVATGQQAGLLGGPLYTLYKTIAAVRWAERLERDLRLPVIPVFWVASEDDDFREIGSFRWQDAAGHWQRYDYLPTNRPAGTPIYDIVVESHLRNDLTRIFAEVRPTEFTGEIARRLDAIAAQSRDLEAFFIRIVAWLLGDHAPLFISPRMAWVRRGAAAILERELSQPGQSSRAVIEAGERLRALGFSPQLHRRPEHVNAFLHRDGVRHKLLASGSQFTAIAPTGVRTTVAAAELRAQLADDPERFGLNVITRPIVQDHLLPTLATVVGPGELGYLAQMRGVYDVFGVAMPMLLPRPQVSLIEPRVERALARLGLPIESVAGSASEFESQMHKAVRQTGAEDSLEAARRRLDETLEYIRSEVDLSDPAVARSYERLREMTGTAFEKLAERARAAALSRDAETTRAASAARDSLWPGGQPQERALNIFFPFLNLFGPRLIERLAEAIVLDARSVQPIVLSSLMAGEAKV